jgi:hypothetical protein
MRPNVVHVSAHVVRGVVVALLVTAQARTAAQVAPSPPAVTQSVTVGDDDGFGGTQGADSNPGDPYSNFTVPSLPPGAHSGAAATDATTVSPWRPYVFEFVFAFDASSLASLTSATVTIQTGSLARRTDGSGFGFAPVTGDGGGGPVALGDLLTLGTGIAGSPLEESVKVGVFDVLALVGTAGPATLVVRIDGSMLAAPADQFAIDFARLDLTGTPSGDPTLTSLTLKKPVVAGCKPVVGTVTLSAPAPAGGAVVTLSETLTSGSVPASITIPAGATSKTFKVTTTARGDSEAGTVSATYAGTTLTKPLTIRPMSVLSIPITPTTLVGGGISSGVVKLECKAAPGPILVEFGSTLPDVAGTTVPNALVPVGVQTAPVTVTTSPVTATKKPKITATANGLTKSKTLTVTP